MDGADSQAEQVGCTGVDQATSYCLVGPRFSLPARGRDRRHPQYARPPIRSAISGVVRLARSTAPAETAAYP